MRASIALFVCCGLVGTSCRHDQAPAQPDPAATPPAEPASATASSDEPAAATASAPPPHHPSSASPAAVEPAAPAPRTFTFDGFALGTPYESKVMSRDPYREPCDNDAVDHDARRAMIYGAKPCRDRTFPDKTTVVFYLAFSAGPERYEQPIEAFAWMGGTYFTSRSDFPLKVGEPASKAAETFGTPTKTFTLERKKSVLRVQIHQGAIYSLLHEDTIAGFVVGPMPDDPDNEQWRGLMQMYDRYTDPPSRL